MDAVFPAADTCRVPAVTRASTEAGHGSWMHQPVHAGQLMLSVPESCFDAGGSLSCANKFHVWQTPIGHLSQARSKSRTKRRISCTPKRVLITRLINRQNKICLIVSGRISKSFRFPLHCVARIVSIQDRY